jgi:hypothetical protein
MSTDRLYLVAGSLGHRLNEALPEVVTLLECDLDTEREGVHVRVQVGKIQHYSFVEEKAISTEVDRSPWASSPRKAFVMNAYIMDTGWAQFACDYITSEVEYLVSIHDQNEATYAVTPTINDLAKSQAESEQGFSLA